MEKKFKNKIIYGMKWNVLGIAVSQGSVFLNSVIIARILGKVDFGKYGIIQSTIIMVAGVAGVGLGVTATKYTAQYRDVDNNKAGSVIGLCSLVALLTGSLFSLLLAFNSRWISTSMWKNGNLSTLLSISAVYVLFTTLNGYQQGVLAGLEKFNQIAKVNIFQGVSSILVVSVLTVKYEILGATLGLSITSATLWIYNFILLKLELKKANIRVKYSGLINELDILLKFALPAALSGICSSIGIWAANTIIVGRIDGFSQLAIFNVANNFRLIIIALPNLITKVITPILCNAVGNDDEENYNKAFKINLYLTALCALLLTILIVLFGKVLLRVFGKDFSGGSLVIIALSVSAFMEVVSAALYQNLFSYGRMWAQFLIGSTWSILITLGIVLLSKGMSGSLALAVSYSIASGICLCIYCYSYYNFRKNKSLGKIGR